MTSMERLLSGVLKKITPTEREREEMGKVLERLIFSASEIIEPLGLSMTLAGSFIRDTWLPHKKELDLFIMFPVEASRETLESMGLEIGKKIVRKMKGKHEIAYAEHPYVRGRVGSFTLDIVPCYKVPSASKIKSAVDRTPFHNKYIQANLPLAKASEVRLLKQFTKGLNVYGSDVRTQGFSGYLCELLVIRYGSFLGVLRQAANWDGRVFIDLESHSAMGLKDSRVPFIVIDPTDPKRNVAAAMSQENFMKFVGASRRFLERPSMDYFFPKKIRIPKRKIDSIIRKRGTRFAVVEFRRPDVVDDIIWSQLRRTEKRIAGFLAEEGFVLLKHDVWANKRTCLMIFEFEDWKLSGVKMVYGPPVASKKHGDRFRAKYGEKARVEGARWVASVNRRKVLADDYLRAFLKRPKRALLSAGVRSYIADSLASKKFSIKDARILSSKGSKDEEFGRFLMEYLDQ